MNQAAIHFKLFWLMLAFLLAVSFAACSDNEEITDKAKINEINLLMDSVPLYPSKTLIDQNTDSYSNGASVTKTFKSDVGYTEIKQFYLDELADEGWQFVAEKDVKHRGRIRNQRALEFQKDNFALTIQFAGDRSQELGWDYAVKVGFPADN
jgi:hypothetical protein